MNRSLLIKVGIGVLIIGGILVWRQFAFQSVGTSDPRIGEQAPEFELPRSRSDETVALNDYRGEPVLLDFWSLTCPPCIEEMRHLRGVHRKSNGEFNIVSINIDPPSYQRDQQVVEMADGKGLEFPVLLDDGPVGSAYDIEIMPTLFLIDADGKIARVFKGVTGEAVISKAFESVAGQ